MCESPGHCGMYSQCRLPLSRPFPRWRLPSSPSARARETQATLTSMRKRPCASPRPRSVPRSLQTSKTTPQPMMPPLHAALAHPMGGGRVDRRRREQPTRPEEERERIPQSGRRVPIVPLLPAPFSSGPFPPRRKYPFTAETSSRRQRGIRVEALFFIILLHFWRPTFHSTNGTSPEVLRHKQLSSVVLSSEGKEAWRKRPYVRLALRTSLALFESTLARSLSPLAALFPSFVHPATLSLSLSLFFFCCRLPDGKATGKKTKHTLGSKGESVHTPLFVTVVLWATPRRQLP